MKTGAYKTRFVVYRPVDPRAFNGTVLVSWNNVSAGYDIYTVDSPEVLGSGCAYVAVSAQRAGVHGRDEKPTGLAAWDPERYGSLSIPSDDYSFDIFTQAARAVAADRPRLPIDPLDGLDVRHLVATGASQSAGRLASYINAVQPLEGLFDAFMLTVYFGGGAPFDVGEYVFNPASRVRPRDMPNVPCLLRDDLDALVMVVNSEVEAIADYDVRQPDSDRYRYWEVAGTAHIAVQTLRGTPAEVMIAGINEVPLTPVAEAAHAHLRSWVENGTPPPVQPRIEFAGEPPEPVRDEHGIARGGIRLPQVEVPLATNSAVFAPESMAGFLAGSCVPFPPEKLLALYGNLDTYLERFGEAARAAVKSGVVLPVT